MAAAAYGDDEVVLAGEPEPGGHVCGSGTADDERGRRSIMPFQTSAQRRLCVARPDEGAAELLLEARDIRVDV